MTSFFERSSRLAIRCTSALGDGQYAWELRFSPVLDPEVKEALRASRDAGDTAGIELLKKQGKLPNEPLVTSGYFRVANGSIVVGKMEPVTRRGGERTAPAGNDATADTDSGVPTKDQVILDDLIVDGSLCVGQDCVNGESFGFDTLRLKENNLRIKFQDTSNSASFPTNDWQLTANDSSNGGANKFSIDDIDGGRTPFTIEASAPSHSLYVDDGGRLGFGTNTPVVELHVKDGDTPTLRLEQDGSSGFTPQTWDLAGNETNFFIRDVTNGSKLPIRIRPGAPTSSIDIATDGDVGFGTSSPQAAVHVLRTNGGVNEVLKLEESGTGGRPRLTFTNPSGAWYYEINNTNFDINRADSGPPRELRLEADGDLIIAGSLTELSSSSMKTDFITLDPADVLEKVAGLAVLSWTYKNQAGQGTRHVGPTAEEFFEAFGLGQDNAHIAPSDKVGIALLAVQGLYRELQAKDAHIEDLEQRMKALESAIQAVTQAQ
jgi:hypothetical protein